MGGIMNWSGPARSEATGAGLTCRGQRVGYGVPRWLRDRRAGRQARGRVSYDLGDLGLLREYTRQDAEWMQRLYRDNYPEVYEAVRRTTGRFNVASPNLRRPEPNISISPDDGETVKPDPADMLIEGVARKWQQEKAERIRQAWAASPSYDPDAVGVGQPDIWWEDSQGRRQEWRAAPSPLPSERAASPDRGIQRRPNDVIQSRIQASPLPEPEGRADERCICDGAAYYTTEENRARHPFIVNAGCPFHAAVRSLPEGPPETCGSCGHRLPHDERWGCMAEVGDAGSGSVADAVFCKCTGPALPEGPEDRHVCGHGCSYLTPVAHLMAFGVPAVLSVPVTEEKPQ